MSSKSTTSLKDFELISKLGEGAFAEVFKVNRKEDGLYYAMKKVKDFSCR
jgi:NIMA (never in mitosis gene a)-related kinase